MHLFYAFGQFIVSEWIWSVTFAWHHTALALLVMAFLFMRLQVGILRSIALASLLQLWSWLWLYGVATLLLHGIFGFAYHAQENMTVVHPLAASFLLGALYALLQLPLLWLLCSLMRLPFARLAYRIAFAHSIVSWLIYILLPPL